MAFTTKLLTFQFNLASGNFGGGGNTATVSRLRAAVKIIKAGDAGMGQLQAEIYGMPLSLMNQLTTFGLSINATNKSQIIVQAGEGDQNYNPIGQMTTIFQGTIMDAWMDGSQQPNVPFRVHANAGGVESVQTPSPPTSIQGSGDVAQMVGQIAQQLGLQFENNNVNVKISNPYFPGSLRSQVLRICRAARVEWTIDCGTLAIWNAGQGRKGGSSTVISKDTIMVDYPQFNSKGVVVRTLFDPTIIVGTTITVQSEIQAACGQWIIYEMDYDMASQVPHGPWFTTLNASRANQMTIGG